MRRLIQVLTVATLFCSCTSYPYRVRQQFDPPTYWTELPREGMHLSKRQRQTEFDSAFYWGHETRLRAGLSPAEFCEIANDPSLGSESRSMAIAQLFGGYVRPGFTSKQMRSALTNSQWLDACWLEPQGALGGPADLDYSTGRPFLLRLFPDEAKNTRWFIYFTLTGGIPEWQISLNDASAFLRGSHTNKNIRIAEFCLFYPAVLPGFHPDRRVTERFTRKGVGLKVN